MSQDYDYTKISGDLCERIKDHLAKLGDKESLALRTEIAGDEAHYYPELAEDEGEEGEK